MSNCLLYAFILQVVIPPVPSEEKSNKGSRCPATQLQPTADSLPLTDVAVLPRPTGDTLAEVSANQVAARVGIDTRLAFAFVGI